MPPLPDVHCRYVSGWVATKLPCPKSGRLPSSPPQVASSDTTLNQTGKRPSRTVPTFLPVVCWTVISRLVVLCQRSGLSRTRWG